MDSGLFCGMAGGIGVIAIAMGQHPSDKTVQANALNALRCILASSVCPLKITTTLTRLIGFMFFRWIATNGAKEEKEAVAK